MTASASALMSAVAPPPPEPESPESPESAPGPSFPPEDAPPAALAEELSGSEDPWEGSFEAESMEQALADEQAFPAGPPPSTPPAASVPAETGPLPALETLTGQIPADTHRLLDELFRARFVRVARVEAPDLKTP